jgi:plastocyanin
MFTGKTSTALVLGALAVAACGGGAPPAEAPPATTAAAPAAPAAAGSASISGKVKYEGAAPAAEKVKVAADPKCQQMHPQGLEKQAVQVTGGGLADAFVYVKSGVTGTFPAPSQPAVLDQQGCMYHPNVVAVQAGQPVTIRNSDDTLHNIHPRPAVNEEFNFGQARKGAENTHTFDKPEVMIPVGCDVHPWMRSYISVLNHPFFAVSAADGSYEIKNLPAGDYEVEVYHGKLKTLSQKVSVKDGEKAALDFNYKG